MCRVRPGAHVQSLRNPSQIERGGVERIATDPVKVSRPRKTLSFLCFLCFFVANRFFWIQIASVRIPAFTADWPRGKTSRNCMGAVIEENLGWICWCIGCYRFLVL